MVPTADPGALARVLGVPYEEVAHAFEHATTQMMNAPRIGVYTLLPFGFKAVSRDDHLGRGDIGTGVLGTVGNVVWLILAGWWLALVHLLFAIVLAITIIGIAWARSCFMLARYTFWPFGYDIVSREQLYGEHDIGTGVFGTVGNVIWFVLAGWWLAIMHITAAVALAVTIIGIPFAWAHFKLAGIALWPIGKMIVPADDAPLR